MKEGSAGPDRSDPAISEANEFAGLAKSGRWRLRVMTFQFPTLTRRQLLVLTHDILATAAAVVVSFFIRFEATGVVERLPLLAIFIPPFVLYAGLVYVFFGLYRTKWRFTSLPDLYDIVRAVTVLAVTLLALDYV